MDRQMDLKDETNRIDELIDLIMKVAKGDFSVQAKVTQEYNHMDALAMGINMMVDDLRNSFEMRQENQRITELNQQLQVAMEKAQESDRLKTVFLQNMSHEIRTPMNAIMGFSDLLQRNYNNKEKLEKFSTIIKQRSSDLLNLINEILDLSKIESGHIPVNMELTHLSEIFDELFEFFSNHRQKINKPHIELKLINKATPQLMVIRTDKVKLKQIFINLINNAFKFTEKGKIEFGCFTSETGQLMFFVSDTGIGIPEDKQHLVFERFMQLNLNITDQKGGTGLGLSIVKGLVSLLGGEITLDSVVGKGSTFNFSVSYQLPEQLNTYKTEPEIQQNLNWQKYTLLIVEDDEFNIIYLSELLSETGIKILIANNAEASLEMVDSHSNIDVILMDIKLKKMNGLEAASILKRKYPGIKIIAQTAFATDNDQEEALSAGCDDYISKPINHELLMTKINGLLNTSGISN